VRDSWYSICRIIFAIVHWKARPIQRYEYEAEFRNFEI